MKRTPLSRKTPLSRSDAPLQRGKPLARVSRKRAAANRRRRENMLAAFGPAPLCQARWDAGCSRFADDAHEPGMRSRGADATDPAQAIPVCRHCHDRIHANPAEATRRGLLVPSWGAAA